MLKQLNFNTLINFDEPIKSRWELFYNLLESLIEHKNQESYSFSASPRVNAFIETLPDYDWNTKTFTFKSKKFVVLIDVYNTKTELIFEDIVLIK